MSIRTKLLLSYAAMLIVPLILMLTTALLLVVAFRGDLRNIAHLYETQVEGFEEGDFQRLVHQTVLRNPGLLRDQRYLDELSNEMKDQDTFLVVRVDDRNVYASAGIRPHAAVLGSLPPYRHVAYQHTEHARPFQNELYTTYQYDLLTAEGQPASLFVLTRVDPLVHLARQSFPYLFTSFLVILVLTHALLTYFMSKRIIRPLRELRRAAGEIKDGRLSRRVRVEGRDEIGQLGMAFEEMRVRLQQSLEIQKQYEANRKELVANISHDLKTPITAIRGYVDGILEGVADSPEKTEAYIRTIAAKAAQMDHLIDELFLYSKLDLNRLPFVFEPVPVGAFLADWAEELAFELEKKQVKLEAKLDLDEGLVVSVDRDSFRRVLTNVIQNSLKYMDKPEREIRLEASRQGDDIVLTIEDNGSGIGAEALPFIFDRFYRADQSRNADTGGSGLGLAIAKQIMEGHGGDIRADSTPGVGTRITLLLPIHREGTDDK